MKLRFKKKYRSGDHEKVNRRNRNKFRVALLTVPVPNMIKTLSEAFKPRPPAILRMRRYSENDR